MTRTAEDIGAGLLPARAARPIVPGTRLHVLGIAGAGASAAAFLAGAAGAQVTGCDPGGSSPYTTALEAAGIPIEWQHDAAHIATGDVVHVDRVAVTKALTAIAPDHPELAAARAHGVPLEAWQQVIADVAAGHGGRLIAVAGTHGKSTSAGWLVHLLAAAGYDPAAFVGALLPAAVTGGIPATARWGRGDAFVVEADEYAGNFDAYRPAVAVVLNAEWDHPDVFADEAAVLDAFERWLRASGAESRTLVINSGDPGARRLLARLSGWPGRVVRVALAPAADPTEDLAADPAVDPAADPAVDLAADLAPDVAGTLGAAGLLEIRGLPGSGPIATVLGLPGRHNAANALGVAAAAALVGVAPAAIAAGLASFQGVGRRLEIKGEPGGVLVLDDYGHHPTAIAATLAAVRGAYPARRVWAVYEPLTYHRTAALFDAFAAVLATADAVVIANIWAGRDQDTTMTSAAALARAVTARGGATATAPGTVEATADHLASRVVPGDVVVVMGGGRSYVVAERLVALLGG